jgi:hypothetical protein
MTCGKCSLASPTKFYDINIYEINSSEEAQYYGYRIASTYPYLPNANGFIHLTWSIEPELREEGVGGVSGDDVYRIIKENLRLYGEIAVFHFTEMEDKGAPIDTEHVNERFSGSNAWRSNPIMRIGKHPDGRGGSLAHASVAYEGYGADNFSDIHIDSDESFYPAKIKSVLLHEMGHALGLAHSSRYGTLMYSSYTMDWPWIDESTVAGIQRIYPRCDFTVYEPETDRSVSVFKWTTNDLWSDPIYPVTIEIDIVIGHEEHDSIVCAWSGWGSNLPGSLVVTQIDTRYTMVATDADELSKARYYTKFSSSKIVGGDITKFFRLKVADAVGNIHKINVLTHNDALQLSSSSLNTIDMVRSEMDSVQCFEEVTLANIDDETYLGGYIYMGIKNPASGDELFGIEGVQLNGSSIRIDLFSGTTIDEIKSYIETVRFRNVLVAPFEYERTIEVYVNDGNSNSNRLTRNINFTVGNAPPQFQLSEKIQYPENGVIKPGSSVILQDDNPTYEGVVLEVYILDASPEEVLALPSSSSYTVQMLNSHHIRVTFGVGSTQEVCGLAIANVTYEYISEKPLNKVSILKWELKDPGLQPVVLTQEITILPINDHFHFDTGYGGFYMSADKTSKLIYYTQYIKFEDIDNDDYIGGFIRVSVDHPYKDAFSMASGDKYTVTVANGEYTIQRSDIVVGRVSGQGTDLLTVSLTGGTTTDDIRGLLGLINYRSVNAAGEHSIRRVSITINDGHGVEKSDLVDVRIYTIRGESSANIAPTIDHVDSTRVFTEGMRLMPAAVFIDANSSDMNGGSLEVLLTNPDEHDEVGIRKFHNNVMIDPDDPHVLRRVSDGVFMGIMKPQYNTTFRLHISFSGYDTNQSVMSDICQMIFYDRYTPLSTSKVFQTTITVN